MDIVLVNQYQLSVDKLLQAYLVLELVLIIIPMVVEQVVVDIMVEVLVVVMVVLECLEVMVVEVVDM